MNKKKESMFAIVVVVTVKIKQKTGNWKPDRSKFKPDLINGPKSYETEELKLIKV